MRWERNARKKTDSSCFHFGLISVLARQETIHRKRQIENVNRLWSKLSREGVCILHSRRTQSEGGFESSAALISHGVDETLRGILCMDQALILPLPPPPQSHAFPPQEEPDMRDVRLHLAEEWEGRAVRGDERCEVLSRSPRRWGRGLLLPVATAWMCRWCAVRSLNTACVDKLCRFNVDVKFCSCAPPTYEYK